MPTIISRAEAKAQGLPRYFTGTPCKHGHTSERWAKSRACVACSSSDRRRQWEREAYVGNPARSLWRLALQRARAKGLPFDLTPADIVIPGTCPVLGVPLALADGDPDTSPSLDRVIPALGYIKGNVRVISKRANRIKSDASLEELEAVLAYVRSATA